MSTQVFFIRALQIIVTVPALLDLLLSHSRVWLPREESRPFPTSSSGIRDSSRAPDSRAGMTEKFDRADVRVTILCRTQISCHFSADILRVCDFFGFISVSISRSLSLSRGCRFLMRVI